MQLAQSAVTMISSAAFRQLSAPQSIRVGSFFDAVHRHRDRDPLSACQPLADDPSPIAFLLTFRLCSSPFLSWENDTPALWSEVIQA